jgi:hypothetical protein
MLIWFIYSILKFEKEWVFGYQCDKHFCTAFILDNIQIIFHIGYAESHMSLLELERKDTHELSTHKKIGNV